MTTEKRSSYSELKMKISHWTKNIDSLKRQADRVQPHAKPEYDRQVDLLVVKLSLLDENMRKLRKESGNKQQTERAIQKNVRDMERAFIKAMSKIKQVGEPS